MSDYSQNKGLIVFIKNPVIGKAKTRIARTVGEDKALAIYLELLGYTRKLAQQFTGKKYLYYSDLITDDEWSAGDFHKRIQCKGDLGLKMSGAFSQVLTDVDMAVLIGSDCTLLKITHLEQALDILIEKDVVIGPSLDGGYYLIALKESHPQLFTDIYWSTENVLTQTIEKVESSGLTYGLLEPLSDIDEWEDWKKYGWEL